MYSLCQFLNLILSSQYHSSVGKKQLFYFFQRWLSWWQKNKCAVCALAFLVQIFNFSSISALLTTFKINAGRCWLRWCENTRYSFLIKSTNRIRQYRLAFIYCCVLVSRFRFAREFSSQSFGITFQRLAFQSWRGQSDPGKQILDRKYVPLSSC